MARSALVLAVATVLALPAPVSAASARAMICHNTHAPGGQLRQLCWIEGRGGTPRRYVRPPVRAAIPRPLPKQWVRCRDMSLSWGRPRILCWIDGVGGAPRRYVRPPRAYE